MKDIYKEQAISQRKKILPGGPSGKVCEVCKTKGLENLKEL